MLRFSVSVVLDTRRKKTTSNDYPLKLRVTYQRKHHYYTLNDSLSKGEWDKINAPNARGSHRTDRLKFNALEIRAGQTLESMHNFSSEKLGELLFGETSTNHDLLSLFQLYINNLKKESRFSTAVTFESTLSIIKSFKFDGRKNQIQLQVVDEIWLYDLENILLKEGRSPSTIGKHMRNIRAIINLAIDRGLYEKANYPFGKRRYQISATANNKRALSQVQVKALANYNTIIPQEKRARDLWLFSYLASGMNMMDMAYLRYKNLQNDELTFYRRKTENSRKTNLTPIELILHPLALKIIEEYGNPNKNKNNLIFDLITNDKDKESQLVEQKSSVALINKYLKRIGEKLELPIKLTTYVARHSYATISMRNAVPIQHISESLGHSSLKVTSSYLGSFEEDVKRDWSNKLL
jgi:integrase/recombinase XerD